MEAQVFNSKFEDILLIMNDKTFGQRLAAEIVGGRGRLLRLIEGKKIRANKPTNKQNGKWFCNAADVLKYAQLNFKNPEKERRQHEQR